MKKIDNGIPCEKFDDIYEFMDTIASRPINKEFRTNTDEDGNSIPDSEVREPKQRRIKHYATETYAESIELMQRGYEQGVRDIEAAGRIKGNGGTSSRPRPSVVGYAPHVPNAIMGHPLSMIRNDRKPQPVRELNLYYGVLSGAHATAQEKVDAARHILDAIAEIERQGVRVSLHVLYAPLKSYSEGCCATIKIKDAKQPLNLLKVSYPLVHPSFHRRQCWRYLETCPHLTYRQRRNMADNYGYRMDSAVSRTLDERKQWLVERGIIDQKDVFIDYPYIENQYHPSASTILDVINRQTDLHAHTA